MKEKPEDGNEAAKAPGGRKKVRWDYVFLFLFTPAFVVLVIVGGDKGVMARHVGWEYFKEMAIILPAVFVIMGLVSVWVAKETIVRFLGKGSGPKGVILSFFMGSIPMGPLYVAFPLAAVLLKKGAKVSNIIIAPHTNRWVPNPSQPLK